MVFIRLHFEYVSSPMSFCIFAFIILLLLSITVQSNQVCCLISVMTYNALFVFPTSDCIVKVSASIISK